MRVVALALFLCTAGETLNPVERVVGLVSALKAKIQSDGKAEQAVYDKYACWCEKTTGRKTAAIEDSKTLISELSSSIVNLKGRLGSSGAEIQNLNKQIAENNEAQKSAEALRKKENTDYLKTKGALEQGIANLEKAIKVLGDATTSQQRSHLTSSHPTTADEDAAMVETRMLTVAAGVRSALTLYAKHNTEDMDLRKDDFANVKTFLSSPAAWVQTGVTSPHKAEYTTQSTAIQGILKDMHDSFQRDLVDANEEETQKKTDFDSLMETKRADLALLQKTLTKKNAQQGDDSKQLSDDEAERKETQKQLDTDEAFLDTTTESCKKKADEWAERSRLRSEELAGINQAIDILTSPEAKATFATADTTFIQTASKQTDSERTEAYNILKSYAKKTDNIRLAMLASKVYMGTSWHFDSVIKDIEKMIEKLRVEEQSDVEHRDWCQGERNSANSANEVLEYDKTELKNAIKRAKAKSDEMATERTKTRGEMTDLTKDMDEALKVRNQENAAFKNAIKADADSVSLIASAIEALSKFFSKNALLAKHLKVKKVKQDPEYSENEDTAPETWTSGGDYKGRGSENTGIVAILGMIKEDLENEMKVAREEEAAADASYRKLLGESTASMDAMDKKVVDLSAGIADKSKYMTDTQAVWDNKDDSKDATDDYLTDLKANCDWIEDQFTNRKKQRKDEIAGLEQAKGALAGMKSSGLMTKSHVVEKKATSVDDELKQLDESEKSFGLSFLQRRLA